jgi:uncharacterized protein (DUF885 family)
VRQEGGTADRQPRITRRDFVAGACALGLARPAAGAEGSSAQALDALLQRVSLALLESYPESATLLGLDHGAHRGLRSRLTDRTIAGNARIAADSRRLLQELRAFDATGLGGADLISLDSTRYAYELAVAGFDGFAYGDNPVLNAFQFESASPYVVNPAGGFFATIPDLLDEQHPILEAGGAEAYLQRIAAFARGLDGENERMRRDAALGVIPPDFVLDRTMRQLEDYLARPPGAWDLVQSLTQRTAALRIHGNWAHHATQLCTRQVTPALARQAGILRQLRLHATPDGSVSRLPDGDAYYRWTLRAGTTTDMSPAELHALGLDQVASLGAQMDRLLAAQGFSNGTVGARLAALSRDPRMLFANDDTGRAQMLAYLNGIVADMRERLPRAFAAQHKAALVIRRVPPTIEAGAPDGYEADGPIDGSAPAVYYVNLRDMGIWPRFTLPTFCFHEGVPGHVWQGASQHSLPPLRSQLVFNAYAEGWALYAEQLGEELGAYDADPFGRIGYLQSVQLRACRLVLDTGLHAMGWDRGRAIRWMVDNNGCPEALATGEVERYCIWPGQACGYLLGQRRIDALRTRARAALGARFDLRTFNDAVLACGTVPLDLLDRAIGGYIAALSS